MNHYTHLLASFCLLFVFLALSGCTEQVISLPYTTSQLINQSTDLNYTLFKLGVYDKNLLGIDGNKISVFSLSSGGFGEMVADYESGGLIFSIPDENVYHDLNVFLPGNLKYFSFSDSNLVSVFDGNFLVDYSFSFGGQANSTFGTTIRVNGVVQHDCYSQRKLGAGGDVGNTGGTCLLDLNAGDRVTLAVEDELAPPGDVVVFFATVRVASVGGVKGDKGDKGDKGADGSGVDTNTQTVGWTDVNGVWLIDLNTSGNLKADGNYLCDAVNCFLISDLNISSSGVFVDTNFQTAGYGDLNMDLNYLQVGNNVSDLVNDAGYITSYVDTNWETSWNTFDANMKSTYALLGSDTNIFTAGLMSSDTNSWLVDINAGGKSLLDVNVIWFDGNKDIGMLTCPDGNVFLGFVRDKVC